MQERWTGGTVAHQRLRGGPRRRPRARPPAGLMGRVAALMVFSCLAAGCLEVKEHLTIRADGSGTLVLEVQSAVPLSEVRKFEQSLASRRERAIFPPLTKQHAAKLFPGDAFGVKVREGEDRAGGATLRVEVAFRDINDLLASPYGEAHALALWREGGQLRFAAHSALFPAVFFSNARTTEFLSRHRRPLARALKDKGRMRLDFTVTLPKPVIESNGKAAGRTARWQVRRSDAKDDAGVVRLCTQALRAACPEAGIELAPRTPVRLGLLPFGELEDGPATGMRKPPAPARVLAATGFTPHMLKTAHSFYLPGRGPGPLEPRKGTDRLHEAAADLLGLIELPRALAPDHWGAPQIDQVVDDLGTDLRLDRDELGRLRTTRSGWDNTVVRELTAWASETVRRAVWLRLRPPPAKAAHIARLRGSATLEYFDDFHVVKLPNAIPREWVLGLAKGGHARGHQRLEAPLLARLGIELIVVQVQREAGRVGRERPKTRFWFQVKSEAPRLLRIQAFDARGLPWPATPFGGHLFEEVHPHRFAIPGTPEPPFSLALLVSARSVKARVPIEIKDLPLAGTTKEARGPQ